MFLRSVVSKGFLSRAFLVSALSGWAVFAQERNGHTRLTASDAHRADESADHRADTEERVPEGLSASDWSAIRAAYEAGRRVARDDGSGAWDDGSGAHAVMGGEPLYLKASNTGAGNEFGSSVSVSGDTVVVGAYLEDSNATGVNGDQADNSAGQSGAAYVFVMQPTGDPPELLADPSGLGKSRFISFLVPGSQALERGNKAARQRGRRSNG